MANDTPNIYLKINTELHCSKDEAELLFCWIDVTRWKYVGGS